MSDTTDGHDLGAGDHGASPRPRHACGGARLRVAGDTPPAQRGGGATGPVGIPRLRPPETGRVDVGGPETGRVDVGGPETGRADMDTPPAGAGPALVWPPRSGWPRTPRRAQRPGSRRAGLFAPDSITWRVHGDPLMGLAALRALLLQALHPLAVAFADDAERPGWDPWRRLEGTAQYIGVTTYGTATEAMLAGSRLRALHARVYGTTRQGRPYTADDPNLLAWVHSCLVASFLEIVTRGGLSLTAAEQDEYIAEQVRAAMLVGLEPDEVPHDRTALVAYLRRMRPALAATPAARAAAGAIAAPAVPAPPGPARDHDGPIVPRPIWAEVSGLAYAALPPWARRLYGLTDLPGAAGLSESAATVALRTLRTALQGTSWACPPRDGGF